MPKISDKGFSLIELLIVIGIAGALIILLSGIPNSIKLVTRSNHQSLAREIAAKQIEDLRSKEFEDLVNGETAIVDSRLSKLSFSSGKVLVEDCLSPICTNEEEAKVATITVTWNVNGEDQEVKLVTILALGGLN